MSIGTSSLMGPITAGIISSASTLTKPYCLLTTNATAFVLDGSVTPTLFYPITSVGITSFSSGGVGVTTVTTPNKLVNGNSVTISGATLPAFNGTFTISGVTTSSFNIPVSYSASTGGSWILSGCASFPLNNNYNLAAGVVYLDGTVYVMTTTGRIYGSDIENVLSWNALNYTSKSSEPDGGVALSKHLNWVVAMGNWSTEFFYNSGGTYPASPLSRNDSSKLEIGCANGYSVVQFENTLMWIGQSRETGRAIYMLDGTTPIKVSTASVERYLNGDNLVVVNAFAITIAGHTFYVLNLDRTGINLIYDLNEKLWYQWSSYIATDQAETDFMGRFFASLFGVSYTLDIYNGHLLIFDNNTYEDDGYAINTRIVTPLIDGGNSTTKFFDSLQVVADKQSTTVQIRHTDDDYNTWSNYRTVTMSDTRPLLWSLGSSRRRAFELLHTDNTGLRIEAIELNVTEGSS